MRRAHVAAGVVLGVVVLALVAVRFYQDRPEPQRWMVSTSPDPAGWGDRERVPPAANSFEILIDSGRCIPDADLPERSPLDRIDVEETDSEVTVTAYVDPVGQPLWPEGGGSDCLTYVPGTVDLSEPIGSRTLIVGGFPNLDPDPK